jgi:hypothetical protein
MLIGIGIYTSSPQDEQAKLLRFDRCIKKAIGCGAEAGLSV